LAPQDEERPPFEPRGSGASRGNEVGDPNDGSDCPSVPFSHYPAIPPPVNVPLLPLTVHPCSYLPGRDAASQACWAERIPGALYHRFMDAGFRRSGKLIYQPVCAGCRACQSIRVPVATFAPNKSQRRTLRRNTDLSLTIGEAVATDEKYDLYRRYVSGWHGKDVSGAAGGGDGSGDSDDDDGRDAFGSFLYDSPVDTIEFLYRDDANRLLAVGICDVCPSSLSSVYFYFDPSESARSLGTYGALREIEATRRMDIPYYYLGYWIKGCGAMEYKSNFAPNEILHPDGVWRPQID
jgi:arginine-tRNA-protein transferase